MKLNCISLNGCRGSDFCYVRWIDATQGLYSTVTEQAENILKSHKCIDSWVMLILTKKIATHRHTYNRYLGSAIIATVRHCGKKFSYAQRRHERREIFFYILTMEIFLIFFYCYGSDKRKHLYFAT